MADQYTVDEFANEMKAKYPEYKDWDNEYLTNEIINKHPEYKDWVKPAGQGIAGRAFSWATKPLVGFNDPTTQAARQQFRTEHPYLGALADLGVGLTEQASSPIGLATEGTGLGEIGAAYAGLPKLAGNLEKARRLANVGFAGQGIYNVSQAKTGPEALASGLGAGLGLLGTLPSNRAMPAEAPKGPIDVPSTFTKKEPLQLQSSPFSVDESGNVTRPDLPTPPGPKLLGPAPFIADKSGTVFPPRTEPPRETLFRPDVGMNIDRSETLKEIATGLYGTNNHIVAPKELIQNALDANKGSGQPVKINLNKQENSISVQDSGPGMTEPEVRAKFLTLGAKTEKADDPSAIGGKGFAKAAIALGGKKMELISFAKDSDGNTWQTNLSGTPDDFFDKTANITTKKVGASNPTGTYVKVHFPDKSKSELWQTGNQIDNILKNSYSPIHKEDVLFNDDSGFPYSTPKTYNLSKNLGDDHTIHTVEGPNATYDLITPKNPKMTQGRAIEIKVLNNGMHYPLDYFSERYTFPTKMDVPDGIRINIRNAVGEGTDEYPFTSNREQLKPSTRNYISDLLQNKVIKPLQQKNANRLTGLWNNIPAFVPQGSTEPFHMYDVGQKYTPQEYGQLISHPIIHNLANSLQDITNDMIKTFGFDEWQDNTAKLGLLFDEGNKGVWLPNPADKSQAGVFVNAFQSFLEGKADQGAVDIMESLSHELAHHSVQDEDIDHRELMAKVRAKYGAERMYNAEKQLIGTVADPNGNYTPEFTKLLQQYVETRRRPTTTTDDLRGTALGRPESSGGQQGNIPENAGPGRTAINKLANAIKRATPLVQDQQDLYYAERGERSSAFSKAFNQNPTVGGFNKAKSELAGPYEKVDFNPVKLASDDVDALFNLISKSRTLLPFEKVRMGDSLQKLLRGELPQQNELNLLSKTLKLDVPKLLGEAGVLKVGGGNWGKNLTDLANLPKSLTTMIHFTAPFRQALPLAYRKEFWTNFKTMFDTYGDKPTFDAVQKGLVDRPNYLLGKEAGLYLSSIDEGLTDGEGKIAKDITGESTEQASKSNEEQFAGNKLAERIPVIGKLAAASRYSYTAYLNKIRADVFDDLIKDQTNINNGPIRMDQAKSIARFVNVSTGRGSLGSLEPIAGKLNTFIFSPRLISSRMTMLNPKYYIGLSPMVRQEALKALLSVAGAGVTAMTLGKMRGGTVSLNPTDTDFGKVKFGNTRIDPYGGFQQYVVAATRLLTGRSTSGSNTSRFAGALDYPAALMKKGIEMGRQGPSAFNTPLDLPHTSQFGTSAFSTGLNFAQGKTSPFIEFAIDLAKGRDWEGKPITIPEEMRKEFVPMVVSDIYDIMKDDPNLLPLAIPATFGMRTSTYQPKSAFTNQPGLSLGR